MDEKHLDPDDSSKRRLPVDGYGTQQRGWRIAGNHSALLPFDGLDDHYQRHSSRHRLGWRFRPGVQVIVSKVGIGNPDLVVESPTVSSDILEAGTSFTLAPPCATRALGGLLKPLCATIAPQSPLSPPATLKSIRTVCVVLIHPKLTTNRRGYPPRRVRAHTATAPVWTP